MIEELHIEPPDQSDRSIDLSDKGNKPLMSSAYRIHPIMWEQPVSNRRVHFLVSSLKITEPMTMLGMMEGRPLLIRRTK